MLVAVHEHPSVLGKTAISLVVIGMSLLIAALFSLAGPLSARLGESGMGVVTRVMGMLIASIAMGMLADGLKALLPGLAG